MSHASPPVPADPSASSGWRRRPSLLIVVVGVVAFAVGVLAFAFLREVGRPVPEFPSLAEVPDPTLTGTVAYTADSGCVRIVAAAGEPSKDVYCIPPMDVQEAESKGKELGPQLVWLEDDRLEITMFRMTETPGPDYRPGWQRIVDVRTGEVTEVPEDQVPSEPDLTTRPSRDPDGREVFFTSDSASGSISVELTEGEVTRTLLSAQGPPNYTYGLDAAFWAPDWSWIAADDGRILVITPDDPSVTRVLADPTDSGGIGGDEGRQATFAITTTDYATLTGS
jgi:hypothetical protein